MTSAENEPKPSMSTDDDEEQRLQVARFGGLLQEDWTTITDEADLIIGMLSAALFDEERFRELFVAACVNYGQQRAYARIAERFSQVFGTEAQIAE